MKRFFTFTFLLFAVTVFGQNLIPDPSAEDYVLCPTGLGILETWLPTWNSFRGSADYFNNCSDGLGSSNPFGFQEPRSGDGYLGIFTFHQGLTNARESFGIELENSLVIGETYYLSFYVSAAHKPVAFNLTSNNIGCLLMVDNYLDPNEQGVLPNFSNFALDEIMTDTINWVNISYSFVSDSAYRYLCFGNFYDDSLTDTLRLVGDLSNAQSYYYFDDFCLSVDSAACDYITNVDPSGFASEIKLFPNPTRNILTIKSNSIISRLEIYSISGVIQSDYNVTGTNMKTVFLDLADGIYILNIFTEKEVIKKRFVVQ